MPERSGFVVLPPIVDHTPRTDDLRLSLNAPFEDWLELGIYDHVSKPWYYPMGLVAFPGAEARAEKFFRSIDPSEVKRVICKGVNDLKEAGCSRIFFIGWSLGARFALDAVLHYPDLIPTVAGVIGISPMMHKPWELGDGLIPQNAPKITVPTLLLVPSADKVLKDNLIHARRWADHHGTNKVIVKELLGVNHAFDHERLRVDAWMKNPQFNAQVCGEVDRTIQNWLISQYAVLAVSS